MTPKETAARLADALEKFHGVTPLWAKEDRDTLKAAFVALRQWPEAGEPDMRHPKIQALLSSRARADIELMLVEQLLEDPNFETTSMEMEHWNGMHDRLKERLTEAPSQQPAPARPDEFVCPHCLDEGAAHAAAEVLAARDCHTCAHYVGGKCWADVCTDADRYEAMPVVRLWRVAP